MQYNTERHKGVKFEVVDLENSSPEIVNAWNSYKLGFETMKATLENMLRRAGRIPQGYTLRIKTSPSLEYAIIPAHPTKGNPTFKTRKPVRL